MLNPHVLGFSYNCKKVPLRPYCDQQNLAEDSDNQIADSQFIFLTGQLNYPIEQFIAAEPDDRLLGAA